MCVGQQAKVQAINLMVVAKGICPLLKKNELKALKGLNLR